MASTKDIGLGAPIWGCPFTLRFPVGTDAGDLETGLAAAADSEVSLDGGAFAACANEIAEIGTDGWYSITLEAAEMQASSVAYKMISGDYGYHATLCPVRCGTVATGTAAAGGAATLTLAAGSVIVDDEYVGYILQLTGGTGSGQAARIIDAVASTRVLTVQADWLTQPDETTTYAVLIPPERAALLATIQERTDRLPDIPAATGDAMTLQDGAITAAVIAQHAIDADALAADTNTYQAKVDLIDDNGAGADRYVVVWYLNSQPVTAGITNPKLQVVKVADGSDLVAETAMTQIASLGMWRYDETTNRVADGAAYIAKATATIGGATRTWYQIVGRDS